MIAYLCVALGSALGGMARYGFGAIASRLWGDDFPWGTIGINVLGSFVIGFFAALTTPDGPIPAPANLRIFVLVGICGGFTTFSSFSLQTLTLARDGGWFPAMGNVVLSVALCLAAVTLGDLSADRIGMARKETSRAPHAILAILETIETARSVLAASALAAERLGETRIKALHVRHDAMEGFLPTEEVMSRERRDEIEGQASALSTELRGIFDAWRAETNAAGDWRETAGESGRVVVEESAACDLVVIGGGSDRHATDARRALYAALFVARLPVLLVPRVIPVALGRNVAIAWKASAAANRAVDAALPLLRRADGVAVLIDEEGDRDLESDGLLRRLRQAGVSVSVRRLPEHDRPIGETLIAEARAVGCDLLVMGAYTHGRVAEFILGGATREVLAMADLPVLMRH